MTTLADSKTLEKDIYAGIVTSLHFYNEDILLAGHGPYLKVYNVKTGQLLTQEEVLPNNRIHRIVPVPSNMLQKKNSFLVYGSKFLSIIEINIDANSSSIEIKKAFGPFRDWIMDAQWIQEESSSSLEIALAFAHNFVEIYNVDSDLPALLYSVQCQVRCILYAARFFGNTRSTLVLASGTVFNQVLVWNTNEINQNGDGQVKRELKGHEGVIFGIRFNEDGTQISSVSDDRTIRVWSLTDPDQEPLVLYGHTARVWDCQFVDKYLISVSEDATCRVWKNTLIGNHEWNKDEKEDNDCIACWEGHVGKNVFCCAINTDHRIVATGGQDSGIRLWSLLSVSNNKIDSDEELTSYPLPVERSIDYVRNFVLIKDHLLIGATTQGYILKCDTNEVPHEWVQIQYDPTYKNYAIMASSECGRIVVIGNILGGLIIISPDNEFEPIRIAAHKQKLFEIFIEQGIDENTLYIISNGYNDCVLFHKLDLSTPSLPTIHTLFNLEMPAERTTVLSVGLAEEENVLICGSRESALLVYRLPNLDQKSCDSILPLKPSLQLRRTHGRQPITSILIKKNDVEMPDDSTTDDDQAEQGIIFWTTGRDGCFIQYRLCNLVKNINQSTALDTIETQLGVASRGDTITESQDMVLEKLYRNKVTKGTLERALLVQGELLLLGFLRNNFFVYNENKNFYVVSINCGGGHRRWQFNTKLAKLSKSSFAFIRKEVLYTYFRDTSSQIEGYSDSILQNNFHGRDVRAIRFLNMLNKGNEDGNDKGIIFATGGEDTVLRIQQYLPSAKTKYITLANIRKHTSVIRNISYSQGISSLLFTSGGLEELLCWKIETSYSKMHNNLVSLNCLEWGKCPTLSQDIETRIMDTAIYVIDAELGLHLVGAVYSDAMIRFWLFNEETRRFSLVADGTWHAKCILQMGHIVLNNQVLFFTSATDGKIAIWDISDQLNETIGHVDLELEPTKAAFRLSEPIFYYSAHMSGVNALDVACYRDSEHMVVVTGGEDNAVTASLIRLKNSELLQVGKPFIISSAHASSVTGIKIVNDTIFTISTDQRLNKWQLSDEGECGVSLDLINSVFMDVPDPSALDTIVSNNYLHVAVTGVGLQSVKCSLDNLNDTKEK